MLYPSRKRRGGGEVKENTTIMFKYSKNTWKVKESGVIFTSLSIISLFVILIDGI